LAKPRPSAARVAVMQKQTKPEPESAGSVVSFKRKSGKVISFTKRGKKPKGA